MTRAKLVPFVALVFVAAFFIAVVALFAAPSIGHADSLLKRVYPCPELSLHCEKGQAPRPWAGVSAPMALGRFALTPTVSIPLHGQFAVAGDLRLRFKLRGK